MHWLKAPQTTRTVVAMLAMSCDVIKECWIKAILSSMLLLTGVIRPLLRFLDVSRDIWRSFGSSVCDVGQCRCLLALHLMIYLCWFWCWCSASSTTVPGQISITLSPCLQLRGDILIKCFSKPFICSSIDGGPDKHDLLFQCQFHTCAIPTDQLKFRKCDLDKPFLDSWFSDDGQMELFFAKSPDDISSKSFYLYIA